MPNVTLQHKNLDQLIKAFKDKMPVAKVGVLASSKSREDDQTNATIGATHEFGRAGMPARSFLRMPLELMLGKTLEAKGAFDKDSLHEVIRSGRIVPWMQKIAITGVEVVLKAFDSRGFGRWANLKAATWKRKKTKQVLVETQQLKDSIDWEIKT